LCASTGEAKNYTWICKCGFVTTLGVSATAKDLTSIADAPVSCPICGASLIFLPKMHQQVSPTTNQIESLSGLMGRIEALFRAKREPKKAKRGLLNLSVASISDVGGRAHNEDNIYPILGSGPESFNEPQLMLVADGVGGANAGEVASNLAAAKIAQVVEDEICFSPNLTNDEVFEKLRDAIKLAHNEIVNRAKENPATSGMSTTVVAALVYCKTLFTMNCGDSRAYIIRGDDIRQLSRDHNFIDLLLSSKQASTIEEAKKTAEQMGKLHAIYMYLGDENTPVSPHPNAEQLADKDVILLCSDGLHDVVPDPVIRQVVLENLDDLHEGAVALVDMAKENAGLSGDNVSVVLAQVNFP